MAVGKIAVLALVSVAYALTFVVLGLDVLCIKFTCRWM